MNLQYSGAVLVTDIRSAFARPIQPRACITEYLTSLAPSSLGKLSDLRFDPYHECCYTKPLFVAHNQRITSGVTPVDNDLHLGAGYPDMTWNVTTGGANAIQCFADPDLAFQKLDMRATDETTAASMTLDATATFGTVFPQGIKVMFSRSNFVKTGATDDNYANTYFTVRCQDVATLAQTDYVVGVQFKGSEHCHIVLSTDNGSTFQSVKPDLLTGMHPGATIGGTLGTRMSDTVMIQCQVMNGIVSLVVGGTTVPFTMSIQRQFMRDHAQDGAVNPNKTVTQESFNAYIQQVEIRAKTFTQFGWSAHLTKWATTGSMRSSPQSWGFTPIRSPYYIVSDVNNGYRMLSGTTLPYSLPPGSSLTIATAPGSLGQTSQYDLTLTNASAGTIAGVNYADATIAVTRVQAKLDPVVTRTPYSPTVLRLDPTSPQAPRSIRETIVFDPSSLTIHHNAEVQWSIRQGLPSLFANTGISGTGNFAMSIQLGYRALDTDPTNPGVQHFFGYVDTYRFDYPRASEASVVAVGKTYMDRMAKKFMNPPPMVDGYYHYYAVREIAEICGVPEDRMAFWATKRDGTLVPITIPDDPSKSDPDDPDPYFLPRGIGMHTWTPRDRGMDGLSLMDMIRKVTGYLCYTDRYGVFQYRPYVLPKPEFPKRVFQEVSTDPQMPNEIMSLGGVSSTEDIRNVVTTIGYDPQESGWPPFITANLRDEQSIDAPVGSQPRNFVGWEQEFLWMDPRFANVPFSRKAALKLFAYMRQPNYTFTLKAHLQHDLYPLDVIYINDTKMGLGNIPFYIMSITNVLSVANAPGPIEQYSMIQARFLDSSLTTL